MTKGQVRTESEKEIGYAAQREKYAKFQEILDSMTPVQRQEFETHGTPPKKFHRQCAICGHIHRSDHLKEHFTHKHPASRLAPISLNHGEAPVFRLINIAVPAQGNGQRKEVWSEEALKFDPKKLSS